MTYIIYMLKDFVNILDTCEHGEYRWISSSNRSVVLGLS